MSFTFFPSYEPAQTEQSSSTATPSQDEHRRSLSPTFEQMIGPSHQLPAGQAGGPSVVEPDREPEPPNERPRHRSAFDFFEPGEDIDSPVVRDRELVEYLSATARKIREWRLTCDAELPALKDELHRQIWRCIDAEAGLYLARELGVAEEFLPDYPLEYADFDPGFPWSRIEAARERLRRFEEDQGRLLSQERAIRALIEGEMERQIRENEATAGYSWDWHRMDVSPRRNRRTYVDIPYLRPMEELSRGYQREGEEVGPGEPGDAAELF